MWHSSLLWLVFVPPSGETYLRKCRRKLRIKDALLGAALGPELFLDGQVFIGGRTMRPGRAFWGIESGNTRRRRVSERCKGRGGLESPQKNALLLAFSLVLATLSQWGTRPEVLRLAYQSNPPKRATWATPSDTCPARILKSLSFIKYVFVSGGYDGKR